MPRGASVKRRVERLRRHARGLAAAPRQPTRRRLDLPQLAGGDPRPFEVVGIPLAEPGYHVVEIESLRLGQSLLDKRAPMFVRTGVLVTNLGVHFKLGRENSVVWVTTLDTRQAGRRRRGGRSTTAAASRSGTARSDAKGLARVDARARADPSDCVADSGYFVTRAAATPRAARPTSRFVFSSWQKGIESWRFNVPTGRGAEPDLRASHRVRPHACCAPARRCR